MARGCSSTAIARYAATISCSSAAAITAARRAAITAARHAAVSAITAMTTAIKLAGVAASGPASARAGSEPARSSARRRISRAPVVPGCAAA